MPQIKYLTLHHTLVLTAQPQPQAQRQTQMGTAHLHSPSGMALSVLLAIFLIIGTTTQIDVNHALQVNTMM